MNIRVTDLEPKEVVAVVEYLLKQGKFSDGTITNAVEKEALRCMINTYKDHMEVEDLTNQVDKFLADMEAKYKF